MKARFGDTGMNRGLWEKKGMTVSETGNLPISRSRVAVGARVSPVRRVEGVRRDM